MVATLRRTGRAKVGPLGHLLQDGMVCRACCRTTHPRRYASAATAAVQATSTTVGQVPPVTQSPALQPTYRVNAGVVLTRPPLVTRDLTAFEKAYFLYQRRLNERLALPFTRYFYFQKGTPADLDWKRKQKERRTAARDIGFYNAYSKEGWNDELLVGAQESETEHQANALLTDAETIPTGHDENAEQQKERVPRPMSRVTEADRQGDERSLDRRLDRTLYMLGKGEKGRWRLPATEILPTENLHLAAERIIVQAGGVNMNTWVVGRTPVGHYTHTFGNPQQKEGTSFELVGEKTFFMKARIMAGCPKLEDNKLGLSDYKWLCKDEIQRVVMPGYWSAIKNMLAER